MALTIDELNIQIAADSSKATRAMTSLIKKLEQLKATLNGTSVSNITISNSFNKTTNSVQKTENAVKKYDNASKKASKTTVSFTDKLARNISKWRTLLGVFQNAANTMAGWFTESNDYIETLNLFNVTMGDAAPAAKKYAEAVEAAMGIDSKDFMQYQGVFKNLTAGFGVSAENANLMSQNLTQLSYDMASFFNASGGVEESFDKLSSAMAGQVKGLRDYGIDVTIASLQEYALSQGIDKTVRSMTQAEKALLRYNYIMEKSTHIQGDMARTIITPANALRILHAQLTRLKRAFGDIISVLVSQVIPYVQVFVQLITEAAKKLAAFFGFDASDFEATTQGGGLGIFEEEEEAADGFSDSLKKIKKQLMGFDELNIISNPDTGSDGGAGGAGGGGALDIKPLEYDFLKGLKTEKIDELKEKLGKILKVVGLVGTGIAGWKLGSFIASLATAGAKAEGLKAALSLLGKKLAITAGVTLSIVGITMETAAIIDAVKTELGTINFSEILAGGGLTIGGAALLGAQFGMALLFSGVAAIIAGIPMYIVGIYDAIVNSLNWLNSSLIPIGATLAGAGVGAIIGALGGPIGAGIGALIGLAVGLVTDLVILIVENWNAITTWCAGVCTVIGQFFVDLWDGIVAVWGVVAEWFNTWIIIPISNFFAGLWEGVALAASDCWDAIVEFYTPAVEWFSELFHSIFQTIEDIFYNIGVIASGCWEVIKAVWGIVAEWVNQNVITPVANFFSMLWSNISTWAIKAWNSIKSVFATIGGWINTNIIQPVGKFFSGLWDGFLEKAKAAWDGVKSVFNKVATFFSDTFKKAWQGIVKVFSIAGEIFVDIKDGIVSAFKYVVNGIIRGLNKVVSIPFSGINSALEWLKEIKIVGLTPFSGLRTINIPQIPLLASGGIVSEGQMFIAREAGPELVGSIGRKTAVANNDQIIDGIYNGVYRAMMAANNGKGGNVTVNATFEMDGEVVGRKVIKYHNGVVMQTGESPLLV